MPKIESERRSALLNIVFSPPFFEWTGVESRFFEMLYGIFHDPDHPGNLDGFHILQRFSLAEPIARYYMFSGRDALGGNSSISLSANSITMNFPVVAPGDQHLLMTVLTQVDTGFQKTFPDRKYKSIQIISAEHVKIVGESGALHYLSRYAISAKAGVEEALYTPGTCFRLVEKNAEWRSLCTVEKSDFLSDGLFLKFDVTLLTTADEDFNVWRERYERAIRACMSMLELETDIE